MSLNKKFNRNRSKQHCLNAAAFALACSIMSSAPAQTNSTNQPVRMKEVLIIGRNTSLLQEAASASEGTVGQPQLSLRPLLRTGEILETVPGLIITQHSGGGKANQFFLRGFNLDHGTDFGVSFEGMPINLPTHGHGQGYTDLNWLIPELVEGIDFRKGPYHAEAGDFSSAGSANIRYADQLPQSLLKLEGGSFNYGRGLWAASPKVGEGTLLYAIDLSHYDGPWDSGDNFKKGNALVRYTAGEDDTRWGVTLMAYQGYWDATDQLAKRAVDSAAVNRFGSLDPSTGGESRRIGALLDWERQYADGIGKAMVYSYYYDLDLFSNFTYFLNDPTDTTPDQFQQADRRWVNGLVASRQWDGTMGGFGSRNTLGAQIRSDVIDNGLFTSVARDTTGVVRQDEVWQASVGTFFENRIQWAERFHTTVGLRGDFYRWDVASNQTANSGNRSDFTTSPKGGFVLGPWAKTEFYGNVGMGFHSNDGRGVMTKVDPVTGLPVDAVGNPIQPAEPLVTTVGAEIGLRTEIVPKLHSSVSFWWLNVDSELVFVGDAGATEASRPSRRYGVEFANYYTPTEWLTFDADVSLSHARFRNDDPAGNRIPGAVASVVAAGVTLHDLNGFFGGFRARYFGPRALVEDNSARSSTTLMLNGHIGYEFRKNWTVQVEVFNILDRKDSDIEYYYESRLRGEAINPDPTLNGGYNDIHFHPSEPRTVRVSLTAKF